MSRFSLYPLLLVFVVGSFPSLADDAPVEEGFRCLFNGRDLTGWEYGPVPVSKKPIIETLEKKTATKDGVFAARDGVIVANGKRIMALYTAEEFNKDFQFKLDFRVTSDKPKDNSGIYIRGPQLQLDAVTDGGLTGVFKKLTQFKPGDWNEIEITVTGTTAVCKCNGEAVGKPMTVPETGTIGLQSEYGEFEFRRIRVKSDAAAKADPVKTDAARSDAEESDAANSNAAKPDVAKAVKAAVAYLSEQQQEDGSWKIDAGNFQDGVSALCTRALLNGGVDAKDEHVQRGLKWLRGQEPAGTYARALQTLVFCQAGAAEDAERIRRNVRWLTEAQVQDGENRGGWSYVFSPGTRADGSCTRFAIWALDAARRADVKVPEAAWRANAEYWLTSQLDGGAWSYTRGTNNGTATTTLAGISCLSMVKDAVADDVLHKRIDKAVERAWTRQAQWHDKPQPTYLISHGFRYYAFQVLGQAAARSGRDKIGQVEWKPSATQFLLSQQQVYTGGWSDASFGGSQPLIGTGLAVLFLTEK